MENHQIVVLVLIAIAFVWFLLKELQQSQKDKESVPAEDPTLTLVVFWNDNIEPAVSTSSIPVHTLKDAQKELNTYMFHMIRRAIVFHEGKVYFEMNKAGVLVAV